MVALSERVDKLAAAVASIPRGSTGGPAAPVYDANVLRNPGAEQGLVGWSRGYWDGPDDGKILVESAAPISGSASFRLTKGNLAETHGLWNTDPVFMPAGTVRLEATIRSEHPGDGTILARLMCGRDGPDDCYRLFDPRVLYVDVYSGAPIASGAIVRVDGEAAVPSTHRWVAVQFQVNPPAGQASVAQEWAYCVDDASLRGKL